MSTQAERAAAVRAARARDAARYAELATWTDQDHHAAALAAGLVPQPTRGAHQYRTADGRWYLWFGYRAELGRHTWHIGDTTGVQAQHYPVEHDDLPDALMYAVRSLQYEAENRRLAAAAKRRRAA